MVKVLSLAKNFGKQACLLTLASSISVVALCTPSKAWEESDKQAFLDKISIMSNIILDHNKLITSGAGPVDPSSLRQQCLLQSIGIDVIHRYLEFNPDDEPWKQKYLRLRDNLTLCLAMMYNSQGMIRGQ